MNRNSMNKNEKHVKITQNANHLFTTAPQYYNTPNANTSQLDILRPPLTRTEHRRRMHRRLLRGLDAEPARDTHMTASADKNISYQTRSFPRAEMAKEGLTRKENAHSETRPPSPYTPDQSPPAPPSQPDSPSNTICNPTRPRTSMCD